MPLKFAATSQRGLDHSENEDSWLALPETGLFVVADGMSGYAGGKVASQLAITTIANEGASRGLSRSIAEANKVIWQHASEDPRYLGMGTTIVSLRVVENRAEIAHVGDSRCYRYRGGEVTQLTQDHSLPRGGDKTILSRAVGCDAEVAVEVCEEGFQPGDVFLLVSDGVSSVLGENEIRLTLRKFFGSRGLDPEIALRGSTDSLARLAKIKGSRDDITALAIQIS